jgi:hypothetical protein
MVAVKLANVGHGGDRSKASVDALTDKKAARLLNIGEASVERAKTVQRLLLFFGERHMKSV